MQQLRTVILPRVLALILWVATVVLGLVDIYFGRQVFFAIYARFSTSAAEAVATGDFLVVILALVYVGVVVLTSEYHRKNVGKAGSWRLFAGTLVVELAIMVLAYYL